MRGGASGADHVARRAGRSAWVSLGWKLLLVAIVLVLLSFENPLLAALAWGVFNPLPVLLLAWGGAVVGVAASHLLDPPRPLRAAWISLAVGAYGALALPALVSPDNLPGILHGPERLENALAPVLALTLVAHLGRRDLPAAFRDWAVMVALALFAGLGIMSMWMVAVTFGAAAFAVLVLLPPVIFEILVLSLGQLLPPSRRLRVEAIALVASAVLAAGILSFTLLNPETPPAWSFLFGLLVGLLVGAALLVTLLTRPLVEAALGYPGPAAGGKGRARGRSGRAWSLFARALVELTQGPLLIALALYLPLRLLNSV